MHNSQSKGCLPPRLPVAPATQIMGLFRLFQMPPQFGWPGSQVSAVEACLLAENPENRLEVNRDQPNGSG